MSCDKKKERLATQLLLDMTAINTNDTSQKNFSLD